MSKLALYRLIQGIPVLLVVVTVTFFLIRAAPGGPFDAERTLPPEVVKNLEQRYNLDAPVAEQFFDYLGNLLRGDFGPSFRYPNRSVNELIASGLPITFELALYAILVAVIIGLAVGMLASIKPNSLQDYLPMSLAMIGICMPAFLLGPVLVLVFGIWLEWLPVSGWGYSPGDKILPAVTLGFAYAAYIARLTRGGMLEVLNHTVQTCAARRAFSGRGISRSRYRRITYRLLCGRNHFSNPRLGAVLCAGCI